METNENMRQAYEETIRDLEIESSNLGFFDIWNHISIAKEIQSYKEKLDQIDEQNHHYEHYDIFSRFAGIFTKNFKPGDKIMWLGHSGAFGYQYGEEYTCTQEHYDKRMEFSAYKKIGEIHLNELIKIRNDKNLPKTSS